MKHTWKLMFLLAISSSLLLSGCRRKPVETEVVTEKQTEKLTERESETEKITEKQTEKKTSASSSQTKKTSVQPNENVNKQNTSAADNSPKQACPYCYQNFSTKTDADGTSEYSRHYAQEKAYADLYGIQPGGATSDDTTTDNSSSGSSDYAQCPYCYQWFSTTPDTSGYSPYGEHEAAEAAYNATSSTQQYQECPYCGLWLDSNTYLDHITNGY